MIFNRTTGKIRLAMNWQPKWGTCQCCGSYCGDTFDFDEKVYCGDDFDLAGVALNARADIGQVEVVSARWGTTSNTTTLRFPADIWQRARDLPGIDKGEETMDIFSWQMTNL